MSRRNHVRGSAIRAWSDAIRFKYRDGSINSERALQFWFCHYMMQEWASKDLDKFLLFIEPNFQTTEGKTLIPDVVVCNSQRIIGVFELKYQPRSEASYVKDHGTLSWFANNAGAVTLTNERYLGEPISQKNYELAPDAVLCWAGIYKGDQPFQTIPSQENERFLSLHGLARNGRDPIVLPSVHQES